MKNIINPHTIIKNLEKQKLNIDDKKLFSRYIKNFNVNTVVSQYSDIFYIDKNKKRYAPNACSTHLINLYKFDHDLGNHILRYILVIEKMLNTNVAYEIINEFHIGDKCLFKINNKFIQQNILANFKQVETHYSFDLFLHSLVKFCSTNSSTKQYYDPTGKDEFKKWENCPLDVMCLTWSYSTTFSIFIALNDRVRTKIINNFGLYPRHLQGFIDFNKNVLHLRNMISHNYVIYNADVKYQSESLNEIYQFVFNKKVNHISLMNLIELIQTFSFNKTLVSNTHYYLKKMDIPEEFKEKIVEQLNK